MKKLVLPFFSILLVLSLALSSFSSVTAAGGRDPWVTPVSGDMEFTATVVPIANLPGVIKLASQMLAPAGYPAGETQFGGNGVRVTGFDAGKATACFSLSALEVRQGWGGRVGMWDGTKWALLPTTIAPVAKEASTTSVCTGITGNGTYAFIKYITDPELIPNDLPATGPTMCGVMTVANPGTYDFWDHLGYVFMVTIDHDSFLPEGTILSYQVTNVVPSGLLTSGLSGDVTVILSAEYHGHYRAWVIFSPPVWFEYDDIEDLESFTIRMFLPDCYTDLQFPDDFPFMDS